MYTSWRFASGPAGDFEALCRRLAPDEGGAEMGLHALDVTSPGLVEAAPSTVLVGSEGALRTAGARPRAWEQTARDAFRVDLFRLLDAGASRAEPGPPPEASRTTLPPTTPSWYRRCTGAGRRACRPCRTTGRSGSSTTIPRGARRPDSAHGCADNQEALVAAAWDAAGDLRATTTALNQGRLAAEIGRSVARRAAELSDPDLLRLTLRQHAFVPGRHLLRVRPTRRQRRAARPELADLRTHAPERDAARARLDAARAGGRRAPRRRPHRHHRGGHRRPRPRGGAALSWRRDA